MHIDVTSISLKHSDMIGSNNNMSESGSVLLAHISDLHCDSTEDWVRNYGVLRNFLEEVKPHIVILTGDVVDTPTKENYEMISEVIDATAQSLSQAVTNFFWVTVPGNHDYYNKGNRILSVPKGFINRLKAVFTDQDDIKPSSLYEKYSERLYYPNTKDGLESLCKKVYEAHNIALFPFDSNDGSISIAFAEGQVKNIEETFHDYASMYRKMRSSDRVSSERKVAILHHHPLPLPTEKSDEKLEPFLALRNAYKFLHAANEYSIDLVLHGHKHKTWESEYRAHLQSSNALSVSSCGSSCKSELVVREAKLYGFEPNGVIVGTNYSTSIELNKFNALKPQYNIKGYSEIRKLQCSKFSWAYLSDDVGPTKEVVEKIETKTKIVRVFENGNALVVTDMEGIRWKNDVDKNSRKIVENIRGDYGRISYGWELLCDEERRDVSELKRWLNPLDKNFSMDRPLCPENVHLEITSSDRPLSKASEAYCNIRYHLFNGYALDQADNEEILGLTNTGLRQEVCTIQSNYPTELIELIIKFPNEMFLPRMADFFVDPWFRKSISPSAEKSYAILNREYDVDEDEFNFLQEKHAIRYRSDLLEVGLVIRHPQPHLAYTLRWKLPETNRKAELTSDQQELATKLQDQFSNHHDTAVSEFYKEIVQTLDSEMRDVKIEAILVGFDRLNGKLRVVHAPSRFSGASEFSVGRGVAGAAFRLRGVAYWEKPKLSKEKKSEEFLSQPPERVIEDYEPGFVLGLPLVYPRIDSKIWDVLVQSGRNGRCPVFAVLVLAGNEPNKKIRRILLRQKEDPSASNEILKGFYELILDCLNVSHPSLISRDKPTE